MSPTEKSTISPSDTQQASLKLAARNFVNHLPALICLRTPIRIYRVRQCQTDNVILTVRLPGSRFHKRKRQPLLVLLLCLCKHFKDLSKLPQLDFLVRKRMQRYTISANLQNKLQLFSLADEDFRKRGQKGRKEKCLYLIIIYYKGTFTIE